MSRGIALVSRSADRYVIAARQITCALAVVSEKNPAKDQRKDVRQKQIVCFFASARVTCALIALSFFLLQELIIATARNSAQ
jgi:hypothetical protein